jgi:hypothetical protein
MRSSSFFPAAFEHERSLYTDASLPFRKFLPQLHSIFDSPDGSGNIRDSKGGPLPACIAMEKGEALNLWSRGWNEGIDMVTGLQVCL